MRNLKLIISYEGTNYCGWQRQKDSSKRRSRSEALAEESLFSEKRETLPPPLNQWWTQGDTLCQLKVQSLEKRTIQGTIEETLGKLLQEEINLIGSGRTDSGVHAFSQVANFKTKNSLSLREIRRGLNGLLPRDIRIKNIREVPEKFNSRYDVLSKTYQYIISEKDSPFLRHYTYFCPHQLNLSAMRKASGFLIGKHNFSSFQAAGSKIKDSTRFIKRLSIRKKRAGLAGNLVVIEIEADGFLYKMVRNIIGTLLEVGKEKISPQDVKKILDKKDRKFAGPTAPAKGLYLKKVKY